MALWKRNSFATSISKGGGGIFWLEIGMVLGLWVSFIPCFSLSNYLSVYLPSYLLLSICQKFISLSRSLSLFFSISLSLPISFFLPIYLSICLAVCQIYFLPNNIYLLSTYLFISIYYLFYPSVLGPPFFTEWKQQWELSRMEDSKRTVVHFLVWSLRLCGF